jgi:hypothetical protein
MALCTTDVVVKWRWARSVIQARHRILAQPANRGAKRAASVHGETRQLRPRYVAEAPSALTAACGGRAKQEGSGAHERKQARKTCERTCAQDSQRCIQWGRLRSAGRGFGLESCSRSCLRRRCRGSQDPNLEGMPRVRLLLRTSMRGESAWCSDKACVAACIAAWSLPAEDRAWTRQSLLATQRHGEVLLLRWLGRSRGASRLLLRARRSMVLGERLASLRAR